MTPPRPTGRVRLRTTLLALVTVAFIAWLTALNWGGHGPMRNEPLKRTAEPPVVDGFHGMASHYAPWIFHATDPKWGRQDLPTRVDFDGDFVGTNNWENLPDFALPPTVYYAVVESETHWFLTYHLFHPRDWAALRLGINDTHENDGENLQVVVRKSTGKPELLFTQAHFAGRAYAHPGSGFGSGEVELSGDFVCYDAAGGRPSPDGLHPAVFVESGGHGIYGALDDSADLALGADGALEFKGHGLLYRPARPGEEVAEPAIDTTEPVPYRLESTRRRIWPGLANGEFVGAGRLLDGALPYDDGRVKLAVPRYYEGDRFSGPLGSDRGISPFAVSFEFSEGPLARLFFDPAHRWPQLLVVPEPWSLEYPEYHFDPQR